LKISKRVLSVDESALVRKKLGSLLGDAGYEVGFAKNGKDALAKLFDSGEKYDLVTLDINMPVMDGLETLKAIMKKEPMPVLMVSSLTDGESKTTFEALEEGAIDFVPKPGTFSVNLDDGGQELREKVKGAIRVPRKKLFLKRKSRRKLGELENLKERAKDDAPAFKAVKKDGTFDKLVVIGSSTGGPKLIEQIAVRLPESYPYPVLVAQHMPESFTSGFAKRLNIKSQLTVNEASNNLEVRAGEIIIAKGGMHMIFSQKASGKRIVRVAPNTQEHFFTPSIDELFNSVANHFDANNVLAIELTGIGSDGAKGLLALRKKGAYTIAESEQSATVYGMPKEAAKIGAAMKQLDFDAILEQIIEFGKG